MLFVSVSLWFKCLQAVCFVSNVRMIKTFVSEWLIIIMSLNYLNLNNLLFIESLNYVISQTLC